jgi:predicted deacylase
MEAILPHSGRAIEPLTLPCAKFRPEDFDRGCKYCLNLELEGGARGIRLPALLARGAFDGKRLVALAGVHGDEYEGTQALFSVFRTLDPAKMTGDFAAVSVANPPAFWSGSRVSTLDRVNMARVFPGDLNGSPTCSIAAQLARDVISAADFLIDLHSGGIGFRMPELVGYDSGDLRSRDAALCFGAKVIWGHPTLSPGRSLSFAAERGIPWLYTEAAGGGRVERKELDFMVHGLTNLLRHLGITPGKPDPVRVEQHLSGDGNLDAGLTASEAGFFVSTVSLLDTVERGDVVGQLLDLHGQTIQLLTASASGSVAMIRALPAVQPGDPLFVIAQLIDERRPGPERQQAEMQKCARPE